MSALATRVSRTGSTSAPPHRMTLADLTNGTPAPRHGGIPPAGTAWTTRGLQRSQADSADTEDSCRTATPTATASPSSSSVLEAEGRVTSTADHFAAHFLSGGHRKPAQMTAFVPMSGTASVSTGSGLPLATFTVAASKLFGITLGEPQYFPVHFRSAPGAALGMTVAEFTAFVLQQSLFRRLPFKVRRTFLYRKQRCDEEILAWIHALNCMVPGAQRLVATQLQRLRSYKPGTTRMPCCGKVWCAKTVKRRAARHAAKCWKQRTSGSCIFCSSPLVPYQVRYTPHPATGTGSSSSSSGAAATAARSVHAFKDTWWMCPAAGCCSAFRRVRATAQGTPAFLNVLVEEAKEMENLEDVHERDGVAVASTEVGASSSPDTTMSNPEAPHLHRHANGSKDNGFGDDSTASNSRAAAPPAPHACHDVVPRPEVSPQPQPKPRRAVPLEQPAAARPSKRKAAMETPSAARRRIEPAAHEDPREAGCLSADSPAFPGRENVSGGGEAPGWREDCDMAMELEEGDEDGGMDWLELFFYAGGSVPELEQPFEQSRYG